MGEKTEDIQSFGARMRRGDTGERLVQHCAKCLSPLSQSILLLCSPWTSSSSTAVMGPRMPISS